MAEHGMKWETTGTTEEQRLVTRYGKHVATVWRAHACHVWHTWDEDDSGGENDVCSGLAEAMAAAEAAVVRQGWADAKPFIDTEDTDFPVCPDCGTEDQDWWDGLAPDKGDGDSWIATCGQCDTEYKVTLCVTTSFSTEAVGAGGDGG